jgi:hypothetical protein
MTSTELTDFLVIGACIALLAIISLSYDNRHEHNLWKRRKDD